MAGRYASRAKFSSTYPLRSRAVAALILGLSVTACGSDDVAGSPDPDTTGSTGSTDTDGLDDESTTAPEPEPEPDLTTGDEGGTEEPTDDSGVDDESCGDGVVSPQELCDDGINDGAYGGCLPGCGGFAPYCGDGIAQDQHGESCDDGNEADGDGCNVDCALSGTLRWSLTYDVDPLAPDVGRGVAALSSGDVIVLSHPQEQSGADLRAFSADGDPQWDTPLVEGQPFATSLDATPNDEIVIGAYTVPATAWVLSTTANGLPTWDDAFDEPATTRDLAALADGGNIAALGFGSSGWLRRYSANGLPTWTQSIPGIQSMQAVASSPDGGFVVVASTPEFGLWIRRYGPNNQALWTQEFLQHEQPSDVSVGPDGTIYATGNNFSDGELWLLSLDTNGDELWTQTHGVNDTNGYARSTAVAATTNGVFVVGDSLVTQPDVTGSILVRRYDAAGSFQWGHTITGPSGDGSDQSAEACAVDSQGNLLVVGDLDTLAGHEVWVAKYAP